MYAAQSPLIGQNPFQNNAMAIKKFFARPVVLIFAITYTLSSLLNLYNSYTTSTSSLVDFSVYAGNSEISTKSGAMIGLVISAMVYASICFAFFFIYARSKSSDPTALPNAGFTIIQVYAVISIVLLSIIIAILVFAGVVIGFADLGNVELYWDEILESIPNINDIPGIDIFGAGIDALVKALVIIIFVVATIFAIALTYVIAGFRFLSSAKFNTRNLNLKIKGSTYFGVMTIIIAIIYLIGAIPTMATSSVLPGSSMLTVVSTALGFIQLILLIVITIPYSGYIRRTAANAVAFVPTAVPVMPVAGAPYTAPYNTNPYAATMPMQPGMPAASATAVPPVAASGNAPAAAPMNQAPVQPQQPIPTHMPEAQAAPAVAPVEPAAPVDVPVAPATSVAPVAQTAAEPQAVASVPQAVTPVPEVTEVASAPTFIEQSMDNAWPTEKHCPGCGAVLPPDSSFCGQCGTKL